MAVFSDAGAFFFPSRFGGDNLSTEVAYATSFFIAGEVVGAGFNYDDVKWKKKRNAILRRDHYKCVRCARYGINKQATEVHHIKPVDEYPEYAYEDRNLMSLCRACHNAQHPEKSTQMQRARKKSFY